MPGLGALAVGAAPLAGGLILGVLTAGASGPDLRAGIKADLELLERIPENQVARRAALMREIEEQIELLVAGINRRREFRRKTRYFTEKDHWRDLVLFASTVLFAVICWAANDRHRAHWLPMFVIAVLLVVVTGFFVVRGFVKSVRPARQQPPGPAPG